MIRFLLIWLLAASAVYFITWVATRRERKAARRQTFRIGVSAAVGLIPVLALFLVNNIQGV